MRISILSLILLFVCCQPVPQHFYRNESFYLHRVPMISHIDDGRVDSIGMLNASISYGYLLQPPQPHTFTESTFVSEDFSTITTRSTTKMYLSRHLLSSDLRISPIQFLSSGIALDVSAGSTDLSQSDNLFDNMLFELSWYLRLSSSYGPFSFGFRPEFVFYTVEGALKVQADLSELTGASLHEYDYTMRSYLSGRFEAYKGLGVFMGFLHKRQPYGMRDSELKYENAFGAYLGIDYKLYDKLFVSMALGAPFATDYSKQREPMQLKTSLSVRIPKYERQP